MNTFASADAENLVQFEAGTVTLEGNLTLPDDAQGLVLFAHGSGSSRHSPRNRRVAQTLQQAGLGTLLIDLSTPYEKQADNRTGNYRFDLGLLAERLLAAMNWLGHNPATNDLTIGLFGASTGAGAALMAAAERPDLVGAVVSRGGRPDLAGADLAYVQAPTLLLVGGNDSMVLQLNRQAWVQLGAKEKQLLIVPGASHLFEEAGTLDQVARLAAGWFTRHLQPAVIPQTATTGRH